MTKPVVIPSAVNMEEAKKLSKMRRPNENIQSAEAINNQNQQRQKMNNPEQLKPEQQIQEIEKQVSPKIQKAIEEDDKILEAIAALQVLGYHRKEIEKAFQKMKDKQSLSTEELIKKGLSVLGMQV